MDSQFNKSLLPLSLETLDSIGMADPDHYHNNMRDQIMSFGQPKQEEPKPSYTADQLHAAGSTPPNVWKNLSGVGLVPEGGSSVEALKPPSGSVPPSSGMMGTGIGASPYSGSDKTAPQKSFGRNLLDRLGNMGNRGQGMGASGGSGATSKPWGEKSFMERFTDPKTIRTFGALAAGFDPEGWGGRVGAQMANLVTQEKQEGIQQGKEQSEQQERQMRIQELSEKIKAIHEGKEPIGDTIAGLTGMPSDITRDDAKTIKELRPTGGGEPDIQKLIDYRNKLPEGSPDRKAVEDQINKKTEETPKNKTPYIDPQGNPVLIDNSSPDAQRQITEGKLKPFPLYTQSLGELTPDAIQVEGAKYATTGVLPPLGMNNPVMRAKIVNAGAEYLKKQGVNPASVPALQGEFKGAKDTYVAIKKSTENVGYFEKGMIKNMSSALDVSEKYFRTDFPKVNSLINAYKYQTGDTQVVKLGTLIYAAAMEFEKIRTAGTNITSAELSIGAQAKAEEIMNKAQSHKMLIANMQAMKTDAKNLITSRRDTLKSLDSEMKSFGVNMGQSVDNNVETGGGKTVSPRKAGESYDAWVARTGG
jgi:hypothetical protein